MLPQERPRAAWGVISALSMQGADKPGASSMSKAAAVFILWLLPIGLDSALASEAPTLEVFAYRESGGAIDWDLTIQGLPPAAAEGLEATARFKPVVDGLKTVELPLPGTAVHDKDRLSFKTRTPIDARFVEAYYTFELELHSPLLPEGALRRDLGVLAVKHGRRFLNFIPHEKRCGAYPPEILAWSAEEKQAQLEAGSKLVAEIEAAREAGAKEFKIPPGHYRLSHPDQDTRGRAFFSWNAVQDFTLDGQGATLWMTSLHANCFRLSKCRNVSITNLTIDYDPLPFAQGRVVSIDEEAKRIRFACEPGFEEALRPFLKNKGLLRIHAFYDDSAKGRVMKADWTAAHTNDSPVESLGDGLYETNLVVRYWPPKRSGLEVGDAIALCPRYGGHPFSMHYCDGLRLEKVTLYAAGLGGLVDSYSGAVGGKGSRYAGLELRRRPNTRRLVATNADGLMVKHMGEGFSVTNSVFEGAMDDALPIQTWNPRVVKALSETEYVAAQRSGSVPMLVKAGATVAAYDDKTLEFLGRAKLESCESYQEEGLAEAEAARKRFAWSPTKFHLFKLDRPLKLAPLAMLIWEECPACRDFKIEDNFFISGWARAITLSGIQGSLRGNTFESTRRLDIGPQSGWGIGSMPRDIVVEKNRFLDNCWTEAEPENAPPIRVLRASNVTIRDNLIESCAYSGIAVRRCENIAISGNTLKNVNRLKYEVPEGGLDLNLPIAVHESMGVVEKDNTVSGK
ncbi:MAG: right-handed parallel beta-helix repeat-containing protein [Planctomycetota bacterium]|nr:right-handed parallel beta-helix repeat-containing protein [Planctomycetota bacterium]